MNRKYSGFTLVEMLIVMGIIIILMAVGIAAGRFAINRANDVAHQNAVDQLFVAAQSYLTDTREYPGLTSVNFEAAFKSDCTESATQPCLNDYLSEGEFKGGTDATFYYWTSSDRGSALVCVSKGGFEDASDRGYYCTGNGFTHEEQPGASITEKEIDPIDGAGDTTPGGTSGWQVQLRWTNQVAAGASHWGNPS